MSNPNTNCLVGMQCPKCQSYGPFHIVVTEMVKMSDDGSEQVGGDQEWGDESHATCGDHDCAFTGTVADFRGGLGARGKCSECETVYARNEPKCPKCGTVERVICQWIDDEVDEDCMDLATGTRQGRTDEYDACDSHREKGY